MQDNTTRPAAQRVTRRVTISDKVDGATVQVREHVVTLYRDTLGGEIKAVIDGKPADVARAYWAIKDAWKVEELERVEFPQPAAPIGKPRAHKLHKLMARLGLRHSDHYTLAAAALGMGYAPDSLAALSETEARRVWAYLVSLYPQARRLAV